MKDSFCKILESRFIGNHQFLRTMVFPIILRVSITFPNSSRVYFAIYICMESFFATHCVVIRLKVHRYLPEIDIDSHKTFLWNQTKKGNCFEKQSFQKSEYRICTILSRTYIHFLVLLVQLVIKI